MLSIDRINFNDLSKLANLYNQLSSKNVNTKKLRENLKYVLENDDYILLGAKIDNLLVGSVMGVICRDLVGECNPFMVMENLIIDRKYRGNGIGTRLMKQLEDIAIKRKCNYIIFVSNSRRKEAHKFYSKLGYNLDVKGFKKYLNY